MLSSFIRTEVVPSSYGIPPPLPPSVSVFNLEWLALLESHLFGLPAFDVHKTRLGELLIRYGRVTNIVFEGVFFFFFFVFFFFF